MKLLITGGFGFLGGRLAQALASCEGYDIILGSRHRTESPLWLPQAKALQICWGSSAELEKACAGIEVVVHMAGMNAEDCADDPVRALEFNAVETARLQHAAIRQGVKRFIYVSTAHVYGSPLAGTITERSCPISFHPYATSHRAGEDAVRTSQKNGDIEGVVIRLSNSFGAPAHKDVNCWKLLVNDICLYALKNKCIKLRSSGLQRRDFITLTESCRAIKHLIELPSGKIGDGLYNVGGAWSPTVLEMAERVAVRFGAATGHKPDILRSEEKKDERSEMLEYSIEKLISTGFKSVAYGNVDQEIDGLIKFCFENRMQLL